MKKIIGFALAAVLAGSVFAAESTQFGWQKGAAQQTNRSAFFSKVGDYKTEAEREEAFRSAGIGGDGPNSNQEHLDVESLLARGLITQKQADKSKADAAKKHEDMNSKYASADRANMSKNQLEEFYKNLGK